jgi:hypothetical protein
MQGCTGSRAGRWSLRPAGAAGKESLLIAQPALRFGHYADMTGETARRHEVRRRTPWLIGAVVVAIVAIAGATVAALSSRNSTAEHGPVATARELHWREDISYPATRPG